MSQTRILLDLRVFCANFFGQKCACANFYAFCMSGVSMPNSYNHMPIATMPNAQQDAVCRIPNGIYNWNLFNSSEKHPAAQSWTCGKVLATNLSSQWICLTSYLSRLHYFSQDETSSPFPLLNMFNFYSFDKQMNLIQKTSIQWKFTLSYTT